MWVKSESTGSRGFQRVGHVQIVRPCFGPVLPGMGTGVRADKSLLPVSGHPPIVSPQCFGVVLPFVPKEIAKAMDPVTIPYEPVPIVVATLMAEVPKSVRYGSCIWCIRFSRSASSASLPSPALQSMTTWATAAC